MTAASAAGAPANVPAEWNAINWPTLRRQVRRLQVRIAKAVKDNRYGKVRALQWLLTHSHAARLLAVRRVTSNRGAATPGVDGVRWRTPRAKLAAALALKRRGYRPAPLRRARIPKSNGTTRPLGIPTLRDRAMQALYALALEPVAEVRADAHSYGFRARRSTADAIGQCFIVLAKASSPRVLLDADIKACFDRLDHEWLLQHIPLDRTILRLWLRAGVIDRNVFSPTEAGTPQGGIISPLLATMALDGLAAAIRRAVPARGAKANLVRYADDFIVTGASREVLESAIVPAVAAFLAERGLTLSEEKTRLVHVDDGFDFLGFTVRSYHGKLLITPARAKVRAFVQRLRVLVKSMIAAPTAALLRRLNAQLRGWGYYYRHVVAKKTFAFVDRAAARALALWMRRRHPRKTPAWRRRRYLRRREGRVVFCATEKRSDGSQRALELLKLADLPIRRHVKIRGQAHPFDPDSNAYFARRAQDHLQRRRADRWFFAQLAPATN